MTLKVCPENHFEYNQSIYFNRNKSLFLGLNFNCIGIMKRMFKLLHCCIVLLLITSTSQLIAQVSDTLLDKRASYLVSQMTLIEKAGLCSGKDFWTTKSIKFLRIPSIFMTDGPNGLRKSNITTGFTGDVVPATCFPTASSLAASWDINLVEEVGKAIGEECQANQVQIILGPGVNIKRSPLCGRNFEYYSEDPILSGEMGAAWVRGVQSQGVGTSVKHFACNNQEYQRMTISVDVDERTLREIYLQPFEIIVKKEQPWSVMASYNRINGVYACENKYLLNEILRDEWGYKGIVVSDWGAVNDHVAGIKAGMNLQMPGGTVDQSIIDAVRQGNLSESSLDKVVTDLVRVTLKAESLEKKGVTYDKNQHHMLARKAGSECIVLLKNENSILPINAQEPKKIAIIGAFAKNPRYLGGGSSILKPTMVDIPYDEIRKIAGDSILLAYTEGYPEKDTIDKKYIDKAVNLARGADLAIIFAGLPESYESEGFDRRHLNLPESHNRLISIIAAAQKNVIVVLNNGSPVTMPWLTDVDAVLLGGLNGQATGGAIADVLFGKVNPSGKLAETYPLKLEDNPSFLNFPGENQEVRYSERVFVGYRYYDIKNLQTLFPFGYGLSYTTFEYSNIKLSASRINDTVPLTVIAYVKNTGNLPGKEIVQLYIIDYESTYQRPIKELKAFAKVELNPGESKEVKFSLGYRDFAFYNPSVKDWVVETGDFEILIGASSQDIRLMEKVHITATKKWNPKLTRYSLVREWTAHPVGKEILTPLIEGMVKSLVGDQELPGDPVELINRTLGEMPIIKLINLSQGKFTLEMLDQMIREVNQ
jgi:beta-glucosidase